MLCTAVSTPQLVQKGGGSPEGPTVALQVCSEHCPSSAGREKEGGGRMRENEGEGGRRREKEGEGGRRREKEGGGGKGRGKQKEREEVDMN